MFTAMIAGLVAAFVTITVGVASAMSSSHAQSVNAYNVAEANATNKEIAEQNLELQKENLEYNKWVQQQTWLREDTAYTRKVADLQNAGLNTQLALGGGLPSGNIVTTTAPQNNYQKQAFTGYGNTLQPLMQSIKDATGVFNSSTSNAAQVNSMMADTANKELNNGKIQADIDLLQEAIRGQQIDNDVKAFDYAKKVADNPHLQEILKNQAVASGYLPQQAAANLENTRATTELTGAKTENTQADTNLKLKEVDKVVADTARINQVTLNEKQRYKIASFELKMMINDDKWRNTLNSLEVACKQRQIKESQARVILATTQELYLQKKITNERWQMVLNTIGTLFKAAEGAGTLKDEFLSY